MEHLTKDPKRMAEDRTHPVERKGIPLLVGIIILISTLFAIYVFLAGGNLIPKLDAFY